MTSISVDLDLIRLTSSPFDCLMIPCPSCDDRLVIHQPDEQSPDRLLGTCEGCRDWFLLDEAGEVMVRLPNLEALRGTQLSLRGALA